MTREQKAGSHERHRQASDREAELTGWLSISIKRPKPKPHSLPLVHACTFPSHIITTEERTAPPFDQNPSLRLATAPVAAVGDAAEVIRVNRTLFHTRTHAFSHNCLS